MSTTAKYKGLPLFNLDIDEEDDAIVDAIALVKAPAIEKDFIAFSKEISPFNFATDNEKHEILGAVMIPNLPMYRKDPETGKGFYVEFTPEVIRKISQVFFKNNFNHSLNIGHTDNDADAYIYQSFITDKNLGINAPTSLGDLPDGSWVACVKVNSDSLWNDIKTGEVKGFSVEGVFQFVQGNIKDKQGEMEIVSLMQELNILLNKYKP